MKLNVRKKILVESLLGSRGSTSQMNILYYTTKAVRGPITNINQSDCFISGPARADIFPVSDRVMSRMIPRDSVQDFCL